MNTPNPETCHVDETRPWRVLLQQADLRQFQHDLTSRHREVTASSKHSADMVTSEIEKLRAELRYQNEKVSSSQKLDMNLERGRIRAGSYLYDISACTPSPLSINPLAHHHTRKKNKAASTKCNASCFVLSFSSSTRTAAVVKAARVPAHDCIPHSSVKKKKRKKSQTTSSL